MRYRPLRPNSEFGRVYARGQAYVDHAPVLYVLKTRDKQTRLGLTATKKGGRAGRGKARCGGKTRPCGRETRAC